MREVECTVWRVEDEAGFLQKLKEDVAAALFNPYVEDVSIDVFYTAKPPSVGESLKVGLAKYKVVYIDTDCLESYNELDLYCVEEN